MEGRLLLICIVVSLNLVASLPDNHLHRPHQHQVHSIQPSTQRLSHPHHVHNAHYQPSNDVIPRTIQNTAYEMKPTNQNNQQQANIGKSQFMNKFQQNISPQVPRDHGLPLPYSNFPNPQVAYNKPLNRQGSLTTELRTNDRKLAQPQPIPTLQNGNVQSQGLWNGLSLPQQYNNVANPQSGYTKPRELISPAVLQSNDQLAPQTNQISNIISGNNVPAEGWWGGQQLPRQSNNFENSKKSSLIEPQSHEDITPLVGDSKTPKNNLVSSPLSGNNLPSDSWWYDQRPQRQPDGIYNRPYIGNPYALNYPEQYLNQQRIQQNYNNNLNYPRFQTPAPIIPTSADIYSNLGQRWPNLVQYQDNDATTLGYQQWLANNYQSLLPSDPLYTPYISNEYSTPAYPYKVQEEIAEPQVDPIPSENEPVNQNNHTQNVSSNETINDSRNNYQTRYIVVHANGMHEFVNNLDDIEVDESNVARFKSKDEIHHILYILEVEYDAPDTESEKPFELPFDIGISNFTKDTNWNAHYQDKSRSIHKNQNSFPTESHPKYKRTTEDPDIITYFKPEYILPIKSSTEKSIDSITYTEIPTPDTNYEQIIEKTVETNTQNTSQTINATIEHINNEDHNYNEVHDTSIDSEPSEEGTTPFDYGTQKSYESETKPTEKLQLSSSETITNGLPTIITNEADYVPSKSTSVSPTSPTTIELTDTPIITIEKGIHGETTYYPAGEVDDIDLTTYPVNSGATQIPVTLIAPTTTCKPKKLKEDLEIDVSELKTVGKPIVWFRPDETFWKKVTEGESSFDSVSIYDVRCKPKLIEREKTIHHYSNGTEIIEFVETLWDHIGDELSKEVRSDRLVINPDE